MVYSEEKYTMKINFVETQEYNVKWKSSDKKECGWDIEEYTHVYTQMSSELWGQWIVPMSMSWVIIIMGETR